MSVLEVDLGDRSYPISIGEGLISQPDYFREHIRGSQVMIVSNEVVAPLYLEDLKQSLQAFNVAEVVLPDGEQFKNLETLNQIFTALLAEKHNRTTTLVALGGGVVGDMAGFAAACYQRGVNFIQVPTTLLSQVDSSVGGKTGVNHPMGKNMIGAFYQPEAVVIDINSLKTLPQRELSAGIAEVIKYGLIRDQEFYEWLESNVNRIFNLESDAVTYAIETSCRCKANVVSEDETEQGVRAILNLGHTFGHAIETHMGYGVWLHGEAVAAGMVMAADLSSRLGWLDRAEVERLKRMLRSVQLPVSGPKEMSVDDYILHMRVDKKNLDKNIRLVLLKEIGDAVITIDYPIDKLKETIQACTEK